MTCGKFAEPPLVIQIARTGLGTKLLGPLFFNIFISDLFYHITEVKLHAHADDEQLYDSYTDPKLLDREAHASAQYCKRMVQKQRYVGQSHQTLGRDNS